MHLKDLVEYYLQKNVGGDDIELAAEAAGLSADFSALLVLQTPSREHDIHTYTVFIFKIKILKFENNCYH